MRIAIFTDTFYPNIDGVVTSITNSIEILSKKGHKILIIAPDYKEKKEIKLHKNISVLRINSVPIPHYKQFRYVFPHYKKCFNYIRSFSPDLIHIETYSTLGMMGARISKKLDLPLIGTYHTIAAEFVKYFSPLNLLGIHKFIERIMVQKENITIPREDNLFKKSIWRITIRLYGKCDIITTPSSSIKRELTQRGLKKKIIFISNGINTSMFPKKLTVSKNPRRLIHVGRISYEKRIDVLLYAFRLILAKAKDAKLTIIGSGPAIGFLKRLSKKLKISKNVYFKGFVPYSNLKHYYHQGDIFLTASPMETQGIVLLEAMSCGLPVIGIDRYAIPDIVHHGKNGYIAKKDYVENIAKYALSLINSPKQLKLMSNLAVVEAKKHELIDCVEKLEKTYNQLIKAV